MKLKENLVLALVSSLIANIILYLTNRNEENPPSYKVYLKNTGLVFVLTFLVLVVQEKMPLMLGGSSSPSASVSMTGGSVTDLNSSLENFQQLNTGEPNF